MSQGDTKSEPWGHKIITYVYVEGSHERAHDYADAIQGQLLLPGADYVGITIERVQQRPKAQGS